MTSEIQELPPTRSGSIGIVEKPAAKEEKKHEFRTLPEGTLKFTGPYGTRESGVIGTIKVDTLAVVQDKRQYGPFYSEWVEEIKVKDPKTGDMVTARGDRYWVGKIGKKVTGFVKSSE